MEKYYRIRATSFLTYYSYVDSRNYPDLFDAEGNPKKYELGEFELANQTFNYGMSPSEEDFEFSDYDEISREEYVNGVTKDEWA